MKDFATKNMDFVLFQGSTTPLLVHGEFCDFVSVEIFHTGAKRLEPNSGSFAAPGKTCVPAVDICSLQRILPYRYILFF